MEKSSKNVAFGATTKIRVAFCRKCSDFLAQVQGTTDISGLPVPIFQFGESLPGCEEVRRGATIFDFVDAGTRNADYFAQLLLRDASFSAQGLELFGDSGLPFTLKVHWLRPERLSMSVIAMLRQLSRYASYVPTYSSNESGAGGAL